MKTRGLIFIRFTTPSFIFIMCFFTLLFLSIRANSQMLDLGDNIRTNIQGGRIPYFFGVFDGAGYSDAIYWGPSPYHALPSQNRPRLSFQYRRPARRTRRKTGCSR